MAQDILDLDALVPQSRLVKFSDTEIEIKPPRTADVLRLGTLGQKLQDTEALSSEQLEQLVTDLTEQVYKCVPELNSRELTTSQLLALVRIISEMATPPDQKALQEECITVADPKAPSA